MSKKKKYAIFNILTGKFESHEAKDMDFADYLAMIEAERQIARRMIKQKLDKICDTDYEESTD